MFAGPSLTLGYACTLLEYCLVTGLDWLDVLLCLRASMIETLCERLDASYTRQTQPIQQYLYVQFLSIKTSLYRYILKLIKNNDPIVSYGNTNKKLTLSNICLQNVSIRSKQSR